MYEMLIGIFMHHVTNQIHFYRVAKSMKLLFILLNDAMPKYTTLNSEIVNSVI